jgi:hypothetical protein
MKHNFEEATAMLKISEIVKKTEGMFNLFNTHFYNNIYEIWNAEGEKYREINLCAEYLDRPLNEVCATLLHEMAHLYNLQNAIQDVSNNGYYHNMKFKATAEAHGLHIEKHPKYSWTVTTITPEAESWLREALGEDGIRASRGNIPLALQC